MKEKLTHEETIYVANKLANISDQLPHPISSFLRKDAYWVEESKFGILASFNWMKPNELKISVIGRDNIDMMISTIAHELHHAWQFEKYGILYFLMSVPVVRQKFLEKTAIEVEKAVDKAMGMEGLRDGDPDKSGI